MRKNPLFERFFTQLFFLTKYYTAALRLQLMNIHHPMKFAGRASMVSCITLLTFSAFGFLFSNKLPFNSSVINYPFSFVVNLENMNSKTIIRLNEKAEQAKAYVATRGFDEQYCFMIDMRIPSGKNRFFVYNLQEDSIEMAGLVAHGSGSDKGNDELTFSNIPNSRSTSLGKYKIGKSYDGMFGLSYKLFGLDKTNSKAFSRSVVMHSYTGVPNQEVWPSAICVSEGCPTVSQDFLQKLKMYIDKADQPIMLWIYY